MTNREKVIKGLEIHTKPNSRCVGCPYPNNGLCGDQLYMDALALLKEQEARHRLEVHNIGNVDIPEGVTWEQFQAIMNNVVDALEHTDRGESWPYEDTKREAVKWE